MANPKFYLHPTWYGQVPDLPIRTIAGTVTTPYQWGVEFGGSASSSTFYMTYKNTNEDLYHVPWTSTRVPLEATPGDQLLQVRRVGGFWWWWTDPYGSVSHPATIDTNPVLWNFRAPAFISPLLLDGSVTALDGKYLIYDGTASGTSLNTLGYQTWTHSWPADGSQHGSVLKPSIIYCYRPSTSTVLGILYDGLSSYDNRIGAPAQVQAWHGRNHLNVNTAIGTTGTVSGLEAGDYLIMEWWVHDYSYGVFPNRSVNVYMVAGGQFDDTDPTPWTAVDPYYGTDLGIFQAIWEPDVNDTLGGAIPPTISSPFRPCPPVGEAEYDAFHSPVGEADVDGPPPPTGAGAHTP